MCFSAERPIVTRLAAGPALSLMLEAMEKGRRGVKSVCVCVCVCVCVSAGGCHCLFLVVFTFAQLHGLPLAFTDDA